MRLPPSLIALSHRNYSLLWFGLLISMSGSMMRNAVILWHVSLLVPKDQQPIALGVVGLVRVIPIIIFSFISGVVADAVNRHKLMILTNTALMLVSAVLALITFNGWDALWAVYALSALSAAFGAFDGPARQSLFPALVPREHLSNAISLNSLMFQTASVLGPALGGVLIASLGVAWAYTYDVISFGVLIISLLLMRDVPQRLASERAEISLRAGWEGMKWVFSQPLIRSSMLLDFFATFFASAKALLPIFAQSIIILPPALMARAASLGMQPEALSYGLLSSADAVGALITSVAMIPAIECIQQRGRVLFAAVVVFGIVTIIFGFSTSFWLSYACLALTGASDMVSTVIRNIIRQLTTPDGMRGRMTSVNMIFFLGGPQLGELEAGAVAQAFGPVASVVSGGLGCMLATAWLAANTPSLLNYRKEQPALAATD
jgi:MFS family permease